MMSLAIRRIGEFETKHLGVAAGLLNGVDSGFVDRLRFDDCEREIVQVSKQVWKCPDAAFYSGTP